MEIDKINITLGTIWAIEAYIVIFNNNNSEGCLVLSLRLWLYVNITPIRDYILSSHTITYDCLLSTKIYGIEFVYLHFASNTYVAHR